LIFVSASNFGAKKMSEASILYKVDSAIETFDVSIADKHNEAIPHVNQYRVKRTENMYYRLSWRDGKKMKHIHIRGGNTYSELATKRANKIQSMIDRGAELWEITAAARTYR
jgi:hypothetical protein